MIFYAHSTDRKDQSDWQSLRAHLTAVGELAAGFASPFRCEVLARVAGRLHDLGKYTLPFQHRLKGEHPRLDHATWGARVAIETYGPVGRLLAYGIAGHHAGLANGADDGERNSLQSRLQGSDLPPLEPQWKSEIALPPRCDVGVPPLSPHSRERGSFQLAFLGRMLFSCLVDADFLDTEAFYGPLDGAAGNDRASTRNRPTPDLTALRARLDAHLAALRQGADESPVNRIRDEVLSHVRRQATEPPGLFSLSVPTGGGKTLASLAFALDHALRHGLRRVIVVIPFTSVVEQTAAVFRAALGPLGEQAVLEHHSAFVEPLPDRTEPDARNGRAKLRLAMENWDAPIIVTTAVQFFESLFAARPSQCRKLHNIAASVVILDEAQTLPPTVLRPCVAAIDELARNYRCSPILCTATQPALVAPRFPGGLDHVRELAPDPPALFRQLKRVVVRDIGALDDDELTSVLRRKPQVLCIVNNRRHARAAALPLADLPGSRHLSTLMCARHRSAVLTAIRQQLRQGEPCRVVATSLVEAGVDVSFPFVLRARAGLDSIAQAAGRCNRNGERDPATAEVHVFDPANETWAPPPEVRQYAEAASEVLRHHADDPLAPPAIEAYFRHVYAIKGALGLDRADILGRLKASRLDDLPFEFMERSFRMIDAAMEPVIVPWDEAARDALRALRFAERCGALARALQPYIVQVPRWSLAELRQRGSVEQVHKKWGDQFLVLVREDLYSDAHGLELGADPSIPADALVWGP